MPTNLMPPSTTAKESPAVQAPDFKAFADQYLSTALGKPVPWESLDAEIAKLPVDPTTGKPTADAAKLRKGVVDSYVNDVLPQHYPREVLPQMQAKARADLDPQVAASTIGTAGTATLDAKTAGYDSLIQLEGKLKDPAQRAENTIALDKAARANGKKLIADLGLSQIDADARRTLIQQEIDKRRKLAEVVTAKFNAGEVPAEQAQADIDRIAREVTSLDGALKDTNDASTWSTEAVWAAGGVGKALISVPEFVGRIVNGTTNWLTDKPFAVGFADDSGAVVGNMAKARQWITHNVEDWDAGDPSQVKLDAAMQAFDAGGFGSGLDVVANHPEVALRMLATSGVDSVAQFLAGGYAGMGTAALAKGAMRGATSVAELSTIAQGAATARVIGAVGSSTSFAALSGADDEKRHLTDALNNMGVDQFLSMPEIQKEQAVWGTLQGEALNTYITAKKQAIIDETYTKTAATTAALLAASGYVGSKYGVDAWLLGRKDALGAAAGASMGKRAAHGLLAGAVGGTHEGLEEVAETGVQHVFYVDAINKDLHDKTPFSNFSGAFTQGFIVGGVMDGFAGARASNKPEATQGSPAPDGGAPDTVTPDNLATHWTDEQLRTPEVAKRVDAAYAVFGGEASPYSVTGLKTNVRENSDGTASPAFFTLDKATRERLDRLHQQAGDPTQPAADLQQSRARHMLMLETARVKRLLETRDRRETYRAAMDATRTPKDDPSEFVRAGMPQEHNQTTLPSVPERNEMVQARADSLRAEPQDELRLIDPAQGELDFEPQGMNYDWLVHGANNPQSQATGTADDQLALPLDAAFQGEDPLRQPAQMQLPFGKPYDDSLTPKPYQQDDLGIGSGWQMQLVFDDAGVQSRVLEVVNNLQAEQEQQAATQETTSPDEPAELPPESNTALAIEAGLPIAEHHTSIANQVVGSAGIDVTVDDKGEFFVMLSNETAEDTRITPVSISDAVENAKTMLPNVNPFEQVNLAIKGIMTAIGQVGKVKNPAITSAVRYAVLRAVLNALPNNYVTHHPSGRRRSEKQMRKTATTWAGLHRSMIEERARIYDAPRSTTAYDYVVGNRTTLTPRLKPFRAELDDLRGKWFVQQNELEALGTDGIIDALVTAPEKQTPQTSTATVDPIQDAVTKVASVEVAQTITDLDNGELMPVEVASDVVTTEEAQEQAQEQLQVDLEDAIAAVASLGGSPEQTRAALQEVEAAAEAQAEVLGVPLDPTPLDIAYEQVAQDATPEEIPEVTPSVTAQQPITSTPKPRKRRKAAFEPPTEAEYITPPIEEDVLVGTSYLNDDRKLDAAVRVSELQARKKKKIPLWQRDRDAALGLNQPAETAPVDGLATALPETSVSTDVIPTLVEQAQVQHEALTTVKRKGKRKVDVSSKSPTAYTQPDDADGAYAKAWRDEVAGVLADTVTMQTTAEHLLTLVTAAIDHAVTSNSKKPKVQLVWLDSLGLVNKAARETNNTTELAKAFADALQRALDMTDVKTHLGEAVLVERLRQLQNGSLPESALDTFYATTKQGSEMPFADIVPAVTGGRDSVDWGGNTESPAPSPTSALDFSKGWLAAVTPHLSPALQSLARAVDQSIEDRAGDNAMYVSFDKEATTGIGGFYVRAWDKAFIRYPNLKTPEQAAKTVLHEKLHQALRDVSNVYLLLQSGKLSRDTKVPSVQALIPILDNIEALRAHTVATVEERTGKKLEAFTDVHHGLQNVDEFLAELSNPSFGRLLAAVPAPQGKGSVLGDVLRAIKRVFGLKSPNVHQLALNDLHRLLQMTAGGAFKAASEHVKAAHTRAGSDTLAQLQNIERAGYHSLTPDNPASLYATAQRDGFGSPAMKLYANRQVADAPLSAATLKAQFDKMDGC